MRTIIYKGSGSSVNIHGNVFSRGQKVTVSSEWYDSHADMFPRDQFRVYESLVTDAVPGKVAYRSSGAPLDITAIIPQFRTPDLISEAVMTFRQFYPDVPLIIVDDGSRDASTSVVQKLAETYPNTTALILENNVGHGGALHHAIQHVETGRFFTMDSDCVVEAGGFLELMENRMIDQGLYAIGVLYHRDWCNREWSHYLSCVASMYDTWMYRSLPPFVHGPHPMEANTKAAQVAGMRVECFPIFDYVWHKEAQTTSRNGRSWDLVGGVENKPRIALYGSTYISEVCCKALVEAGYNIVGFVPCRKSPTVPGRMCVPAVDVTAPHDVKLSIQYDDKIKLDHRPGYNLHTGLLPEWGGCDILYHTLREGVSSQGLTFHKMTDQFDQGPIVSRISYPVLPGDDMVALYRRMARLAPRFVVVCMELLDILGDGVEACESAVPRVHKRGRVAPEDADLYALTPEQLREAFRR